MLEQFQIHHRLVKWRILDQRSADDKILPYGYSTQEAFSKFDLQHIVRENNERVNLLSKLASTKKKSQHRTFFQETVLEPSLYKVVVSVTLVNRKWMTEIWDFQERLTPKISNNNKKAKKTSNYYVIDGGDLYRRGFTTPLLKCLTQDLSEYVMNEMHRGIYGMHLGS